MKVRCIDASDCNRTLTVGKVYEVKVEDREFPEPRYWLLDDNGLWGTRYQRRFEPVPDEPEAPAEQPKVDRYEAHRLATFQEERIAEKTAKHDSAIGATARLLRGLEGEKVRERVRPFPAAGRNFELKGKR